MSGFVRFFNIGEKFFCHLNLYIDEEQTKQCPKEKVQTDKEKRSTKHTYKTKDRVTRTQLKSAVRLFMINDLQ
jgi:hypothetical protein